jgi:uncharacterized protein
MDPARAAGLGATTMGARGVLGCRRMESSVAIGLALLGVVVGTLGTLIGAGGGFLLLPVLAFLYPHESPALLTAISLTVVFLNASSGSLAYARMRRIDVRAGLAFATAGLPGAIIGAWATHHLDRREFDPLLGIMLVLSAALVQLKPGRRARKSPAIPTRTLVERDGTTHVYSPRVGLGALLSVLVGFLSSLLGIGGGVIHVPLMVYVLGFPTHVATATSHFVLALLTLAAVLVHGAGGGLGAALSRIVPLGAGVLAGAQAGAWLSSRVHGRWIMIGLAVALASVGVRLLIPH